MTPDERVSDERLEQFARTHVRHEGNRSNTTLPSDELRSMALELAQRRSAGWQPISTAPRDGTAVFAYWPLRKNMKTSAKNFGFVTWQGHCWCNAEDSKDEWADPTHWQPLPPPPFEQEDGKP
jgi:hypothetical protein